MIMDLIKEAFSSKKKSSNMDSLIRSKEAMLRRGNPSAKGALAGPAKGDGRKFKSKTEELYTLEFESLSKAGGPENKKEDAKKMLELLGNGQWGEGPLFQEIKSLCSQKVGKQLELSFISKHINSFINREIALVLDKTDLPSYNEIRDALITKVVFHHLFEEARLGDGPYLKRIASRFKVSSYALIKAFDYLTLESARGKSKEVMAKVINSPKMISLSLSSVELEKGSHQILIGGDGKRFINTSTFMKNFENLALVMESLERIPPLRNKKDLKGALNIFEMEKNPSPLDVKKRYKKLAQLKHPDRLAAKGLSTELEKIATDNFAVIQQAYHIILDHIDGK